jgi:hypothetical protein
MRFSPPSSASEKPEFKLPDGDAKLKWFVSSFLKGFRRNQVGGGGRIADFGLLRSNPVSRQSSFEKSGMSCLSE